MNIVNSEFLETMIEISRLKRKLLESFVSERTMGHLDKIGHEIKEMLIESIIDSPLKEINVIKDKKNIKVSKIEIE